MELSLCLPVCHCSLFVSASIEVAILCALCLFFFSFAFSFFLFVILQNPKTRLVEHPACRMQRDRTCKHNQKLFCDYHEHILTRAVRMQLIIDLDVQRALVCITNLNRKEKKRQIRWRCHLSLSFLRTMTSCAASFPVGTLMSCFSDHCPSSIS